MTRLALAVLATFAMPALAQPVSGVVTKEGRDLVVVSDLTTHGVDNYKWLYRFIEANSASLAQQKLGTSYRKIVVLNGENATLANFTAGLGTYGADAEAKAVDVFLHLHGGPGTLWFHEGAHSSEQIRDDLLAQDATGGKLRLLYSTACYGDSHAKDFVAAGFQVASGAVKVNTNSAHDYPAVMEAWKNGATFEAAQASGNNEFWRNFWDGVATRKGFGDADSLKIVHGAKELTIDGTNR